MPRYIFIPNEKSGKHLFDGKRGTLVTILDDKAAIVTPHSILTEKPTVTDFVDPVDFETTIN